MERLVLACLRWQIGELHHLLFAFQPRRSATTCLMTLLGELRSRSGLVVFLDLEKAFELARPSAILEALAERGIGGRLLQWIAGFLTGRSARVHFQGRLSTAHAHTLGPPQGSCLSPFLFNMLMGKLLEDSYGPGVRLLCYADDLALYIPKHSHQVRAPLALGQLQRRCTSLGLKINPDKSSYMTFGLPSLPQPLKIDSEPLRHVTTHQYLGVWFDTNLSFRPQVRHLQDRTAARVRVLRCLSGWGTGATQQVKRLFYTAAIRSVLDYCAPCLSGLAKTNF
ncbi:putative RNA-directed DNA polymerase from transposon BS [Chionoecetes opilio]|uniref:Putative RNA-directed DNA polymerase from transposon BS n=1 Tax=Chionoecetes opilio TaxID=41210 RepID=A0A8J5D5T1_CHIOP|nr:putative RNA-directed DNA polymerase from transposon BS [Chionoecetes opilio]